LSNFKIIKMKKIVVLLGIILLSSTQFSCSKDDDQDLSAYALEVDTQATGGEDGQILPPPPPPPGGGN
jgi:hypothetical protein